MDDDLEPASGDRAGAWPVRPIVRRVLTRTFGSPPIDASGHPGDPGLLGPDSASWRLVAEPAAIAGGIRGLILQVAHPLAVAGVDQHSRFRADPLGRLQRTSLYVAVTTYGATEEALAAIAAVREVHTRVHGSTGGDRRYAAGDPALLAWVSVALSASFLAADRHFCPRPLDDPAADTFVDEQAHIAALLDPRVELNTVARDPGALDALRARRIDLPMLADGTLPRTRDELDGFLARVGPELGLHAPGRRVLRFVLEPPLRSPTLQAYRILRDGAVASLTRLERDALELPDPGDRAILRARRLVAAMRWATGTSPTRRVALRRAGGGAPPTADQTSPHRARIG